MWDKHYRSIHFSTEKMQFADYGFLKLSVSIGFLGHNVKIYLLCTCVCVYVHVYTCECADRCVCTREQI